MLRSVCSATALCAALAFSVQADTAIEPSDCAHARSAAAGEFGDVLRARGGANAGVWYAYVAPLNGFLYVHVQGASEQTVIEAWSACPDTGEKLGEGWGLHAPEANAAIRVEPGQVVYLHVRDPDAKDTPIKVILEEIEVGGPGGASPDVILNQAFNADTFGQFAGIRAYSIPSFTCNIGNQSLLWVNRGTPALAMNAYRLHDGRLIQLGLGFCKTACCVGNGPGCPGLTCSGGGGGLIPGCQDVYGSGFNAIQSSLAPRSVINPFTGVIGSFSADSGNDIFRRLQVRQTDLQVANFPGALYFVEGVYVATDDAAGGRWLNNATWVRVVPNQNTWNLDNAGPDGRMAPAIKAWRVHGLGVNQVDNRVVDAVIDVPGEGRFHAATKVTELGGGQFRFDYAVFNLNSDRAGGSFSVPIPPGATVTNIGFHDVDYHSGEPYSNADWVVEQTGNRITWRSPQTFAQNPNSNALRWGTMYNFWFDVNRQPGDGEATLGLFKPGTPADVSMATRVPVGPTQIAGDTNCDGLVNFDDIDTFVTALISQSSYESLYPFCRYQNADVNGDSAVNFEDIDSFVVCIIEAVCG